MEGIKLFFLLLVAVPCTSSDVPRATVEKSLPTSMDFIPPNTSFRDNNEWHKGEVKPGDPKPADPLFRYFNKQWIPKSARQGMSVGATGALSIDQVKLVDDGYYTCISNDDTGDPVRKSQLLQVYIQPKSEDIKLDTNQLDLDNLEAGICLEVTCTIDHLFPNITKDKFTMNWGAKVCPGSEDEPCLFDIIKNADPELDSTVTLQWTKNLTADDDGAQINCTVYPEHGTPVTSKSETLRVLSPTVPAPPPSGLSGGAIAGIVIGCVVGVALISVGIYFGVKSKQKRTTALPNNNPNNGGTDGSHKGGSQMAIRDN